MPTKKVSDTKQTTQFAPAGMGAYNQLTPQMAQTLGMYMQNPLTASYFQQQLGMANRNIGQQGQSNMLTMLSNARQFGSQSNNAFLQSQMGQQRRAQSANQSNAFTNLLLGAEGNRRWAAGAGAGYSPLVTGQTGHSEEKTSGVGTWLPQLAGAAIGGLSNAFMPKPGGLMGPAANMNLPLNTQSSAFGGSRLDSRVNPFFSNSN